MQKTESTINNFSFNVIWLYKIVRKREFSFIKKETNFVPVISNGECDNRKSRNLRKLQLCNKSSVNY